MAVKWIVADIDGCISPDESVPWNLESFGRFAHLVREASAGRGSLPPLTLCTGRPQPYCEVLMKILDIRVPVIAENGAVLYSLHDNVARYGPGVTEEKLLGLRAVREFIETKVFPEFPDAVYQFGKEAQLSIFSERTEIFESIKQRVEEYVAQQGGPDLLINASPCYLNISLNGVDKGSTLRMLLDELGATHDEVAGVGDSVGDLPLRNAVGFFACPANADLEVKAAADYVSPYENIDGMLDILTRSELQH
ncbi:MAG: HAD hydrolase family protein [Nitrospiraceae bacterium]|nr:HAD hydrolase family protein [Nitrospiraceae bacterium]